MNSSKNWNQNLTQVALLIWATCWLILSWFTPANILWRDSGEFIIQGTYLDVAHPAGFPLYGQLAHLFAQIPIGPIPWRINLFSTFLASTALGLIYIFTIRVLVCDLKLSNRIAFICGMLAPILIACSETFLRQAYSAEVYVLSFNLLLILLLCTHSWWHERKDSSLIAAAFIAGLALGNHVSLALTYLFILPLLFFHWKRIKNCLLPCVMVFILGLSVYLYIPIRASSNPPLNTGMANSWHRFLNHISNERDWMIRGALQEGEHATNPENKSINEVFNILGGDSTKIIINDSKRVVKEVSLFTTLLGIVGIFLLTFNSGVIGSIVALSALSTWLFFSGWHPDPWLPIFFTVALGTTTFIALLTKVLLTKTSSPSLAVALPCSLASLLILGSARPNLTFELEAYKRYSVARDEGRARLRSTKPNSYYLTEPSLFLLLYTTAIEGYRDDVNVVYLLDLYYPELFVQRVWQGKDGKIFTPSPLPLPHLPSLENVSNFVNFTSTAATIYAEPVTLLNSYLREVVKLNNQGMIELQRNNSTLLEPAFVDTLLLELEHLIEHFYQMPHSISQDVAAYIELRAMLYSDLLYSMKMPLRAAQVLSLLCDQPDRRLCFAPVENNLKAYRALLYDKGSKENVNN